MPSIADRAANVALYSFESAQLPPDTFQVLRFEGTEGISEPFKFELQLISNDPDIEFSKVVNEMATFTMMRGDEEVPINGIVTDFSLHGRTEDYVVYRATLRPRLHRLSLSYGSRIFQEKKVEDILRTVLKEAGLSSNDFRFALQESYSPREYCVQYEETDLSFISRLMEFEGMYYFFEHEEGQDTLVFTDKKGEHEKIPAPASLRYHEGAGGMVEGDQETVRKLICEEQMVTGKVQLRDYNYREPEAMTVESEMDGGMPGERYEYGDSHFRDKSRGKRLADVRKEEAEARKRVLTGESDSMGFRSGFLFTLERHYRKSLNADYLITQIEHRGSQRAGLDVDAHRPRPDGEPEPEYRNHFTCIPATVQYRPPRETPKPEVPGVLTAKIESAGGDYAYIDDEGRYRAKMHFDRLEGDRAGRSEGSRTLPVRMKQAYSGSDYGIHFPNHADTEMIVAFENGDIDRPVALGTAPNAAQSSPVTSENKTQNVVRSYAGNQILIDDQDGATKIQLTTTGGHSASLDDGGPKIAVNTSGEHSFVMDDDGKRIFLHTADGHGLNMEEGDVNGILMYTNGQNSLSMNDDDEMIVLQTGGGHTLGMDDPNKKVQLDTTDGHGVELNDQTKKAKVGTAGDRRLECDDTGKKVLVQGDDSNKIKIADSEGKVTVKAGSEIKLQVGGSSLTMKEDGTIDVNGKEINLKVGQNSINIKPSEITISGSKISSAAQAINEITGATVKIN